MKHKDDVIILSSRYLFKRLSKKLLLRPLGSFKLIKIFFSEIILQPFHGKINGDATHGASEHHAFLQASPQKRSE